MDLVSVVEKGQLKKGIPDIKPGDMVRVHNRIVEGDRERIQVFQGVVMRIRKGGARASFTVRRIAAHGIGVERTFPLHSPRIEKIEIMRRAKLRRAQLYYLRGRIGKAARLKEQRFTPEELEAAAESPKAPEEMAEAVTEERGGGEAETPEAPTEIAEVSAGATEQQE